MMVQWNPWNDLARLETAMNHLLVNRRADGNGAEKAKDNRGEGHASWQPAVDVYEDGEKFLLIADLPGVAESDLEISIDKNVLTLKGARKAQSGPDNDSRGLLRSERVKGAFSRAFTIPSSVDPDKVSASLKDGVLTLALVRKAEAQ